jgi:hypothetical protein
VGAREEPFAAGYNASAQSYFSYDGKTVTLPYDGPGDGDVADWNYTVSYDPFGSAYPGAASPVSTTDLEEMNVLGYDLACFVTGTAICTLRGDIAVEALHVGDLAVTASGALRPVVWIGSRRLDLARHPQPLEVQPVRVEADAFGVGLPCRDLWLSPGHSVAFEGALIPVSRLVNGRSVAQVACAQVEYWHVELDGHDVILAEGLPAESYLDTGNRTAFANGGQFVEAHPDFAQRHWADTCLPLALDGLAVTATRARLLARLAEAGCGVTQEADAHILVDGLRVEPIRLSATRFAFALPPGGREIALRSRCHFSWNRDPATGLICVQSGL